jgi:hypothetical protein
MACPQYQLVTIDKETRMEDKKAPTHLIFAGVEFLLAMLTLLPTGAASKASLLGYKALCSFSPISTLGLLALVGLHLFLHYRKPAVKS